MEFSRYELAAVNRTVQNVKMLRNKLAKVTEKYNKIAAEKAGLEEEIENWETPIRRKYGFSSEEILSGEADRPITVVEEPQSDYTMIDNEPHEVPETYDAPGQAEWEPAQTATEETASTEL